MPIIEEQDPALFERSFRTQETNAPHVCGLEWHFSSMLPLLGRLERHPSSILRFRGGSSGAHRAFCGSGAYERHPSSILRLRGRLKHHFSSILRLWGGLERPFRAICGLGRARAAISSHLRLRAKLEGPYAANSGISRGKAGRPRSP